MDYLINKSFSYLGAFLERIFSSFAFIENAVKHFSLFSSFDLKYHLSWILRILMVTASVCLETQKFLKAGFL